MVCADHSCPFNHDSCPGFEGFFFFSECQLSDTISAHFDFIKNQALMTIVYKNLGFIPMLKTFFKRYIITSALLHCTTWNHKPGSHSKLFTRVKPC